MRNSQDTITMIAVLGSVILVNILSQGLFHRFDLTEDDRYTLSDASKAVLNRLEDPVNIKAYFTEKLPAQYKANRNYVQDLLDEYYNQSKGLVRYEFIDPMGNEDDLRAAQKESTRDIFGRQQRPMTEMERELSTIGIPPVKIQVNENDKIEIRRAYMGLDIRYGEKHEPIPVVQDINKLEYIITTLVRKMTRPKTPRLAVLTGHDGPSLTDELSKLNAYLSEQYQIVPLDLSQKHEIEEDIDALAVIGPKTALSEQEKKAIDKFIVSGKSVAFFLDQVSVDLKSFTPEALNHGLYDQLMHYGITIDPSLIGDVSSSKISIQQRQAFLVINHPVQYYYMPLVEKFEDNNPIANGLGQVAFPFVSPITWDSSKELQFFAIAQSSEKSWKDDAMGVDLNPMQDWAQRDIKISGSMNMAVAASGIIKPFYGENAPTDPQPSRIAVFGTSTFVQNQFLQPPSVALLMNTFDWLLMDDELLAMRARGLDLRPLESDMSHMTKASVKYGNVFGPAIILILFGLGRWRRRSNKRQLLAQR